MPEKIHYVVLTVYYYTDKTGFVKGAAKSLRNHLRRLRKIPKATESAAAMMT